jgi:flagellum-specific ATP synthase
MLDFSDAIAKDLQTAHAPSPERSGTLVRLVGLTLEARGVIAPLGAVCEVAGLDGTRIEAEVVGFNDQTIYLMPFTEPTGHWSGRSRAGADPCGACELRP